jgi:putative oxidoreductase
MWYFIKVKIFWETPFFTPPESSLRKDRSMFKSFFRTNKDWASLFARLSLGIVMLPHGLQKVAGSFGGSGFEATLNHFTANLGIPMVAAVLVILAESLGAIGLIIGFCTRLCALGIALVMTGAIVMVHWQHGFFMNWFGKQSGEGFEYHILAIGLALVLIIRGGGILSIDRGIAES